MSVKQFQVKYVKETRVIKAGSLQQLRSNIAEVFCLDLEKLKITKPLLKDQKAFDAYKGTQISVIGQKAQKTIKQELKQPEVQSQFAFVNLPIQPQRPPQTSAPDPTCRIAGLIDDILGQDAEGFALFFLILPIWELRHWIERKLSYEKKMDSTVLSQSNLWDKEFHRMYSKVISPQDSTPVSYFAMSCAWANARAIRDIGCPERCHPSQMILELPEIVGAYDIHPFRESQALTNLLTFNALFQVSNITNQQTKAPEERLQLTPEGIVQHELGCLNLNAYMKKDKTSLNEFLNAQSIEVIKGEQFGFKKDLSFTKKFNKFITLPTYLFIRIDRFSKQQDNFEDSAQPIIKSDNPKWTYGIEYPKYIDVYDLCSREYRQRNAPSRQKLKDLMRKYAHEIEKERKHNSNLNDIQIAFSLFQRGLLSQWLLEDMLYLCNDQYNPNSHTGVYHLVGFITHQGGRQAEDSKFGTVIQFTRNNWYYCRGSQVRRITTEDALTKFQGTVSMKFQDMQIADMFMYRKVFLDEDYDIS